MKTVGIIGFGKIGQALAARILSANPELSVMAVDVDEQLPLVFKSGDYTAQEPGIGDILNKSFRENRLTLGSDYSGIRDCSGVLVSVPLIVNDSGVIIKDSFLECFKRIAEHVTNGCVVCIETSVPVGFCRAEILPLLESFSACHGKDFHLVHSPERIKSGSMLDQLGKTPKLIGGVDAEAGRKGVEFYAEFMDVNLLKMTTSLETAEFIKLAGMVYRDVNIALANSLAKYCHAVGMDMGEVIRYANTDGEAALLSPGIGVGGHCTPVYPYFLLDGFKEHGIPFDLAAISRKINDDMARFAVDFMKNDRFEKALLLGLGFRPGVKDDTFSPAYKLRDELNTRGITTLIHDPLYAESELTAKKFTAAADIYNTGAEVVFLVTAHPEYDGIDWQKLKACGCKVFVDGRNHFDPGKITAQGIKYFGIGRGN